MELNFWHKIWENNHVGFHEGQANFLFVEYINALSLTESARIFLPLKNKRTWWPEEKMRC